MTPSPITTDTVTPHETQLEDPWFVEAAPASEPAPSVEDPELDSQWFTRGRPLSDRPPPPDAEA